MAHPSARSGASRSRPAGLAGGRAATPAPASPPTGREDRAPDLSQAAKAALPASLEPQLATLASAVPTAGRWLIENKFDGYRIMARIEGGQVRLITRGGHDWTDRMASLAKEVGMLDITSGWLDGEIVVMNSAAVPDFNALQNAFESASSESIRYFVFDAPFLDGLDLRRVPLWSRRALLARRLQGHAGTRVQFSEDFDLPPAAMLDAACRIGLEGIIVKQEDSRYVSARSDTWLKLKCSQRQEFVVIGFTDRTGAHGEVGGLLLGYHDGGRLRYAGSVGTGWDAKTGRDLHARLVRIESGRPAVEPSTVKPGRWSRRAAGSERWVTPELVAEVAFSEWTADGHVRHPTFKGLREDKPALAITREAQAAPPAIASARAKPVKVSNPERVIDPSTGLTKGDLVRFYEGIAGWMLPHLKDRPVSLVRAPTGIAGELFFQKHAEETAMPGLTKLDPALWPGHGALLAVNSAQALVTAAQMNTVEFHTWNSTTRKVDLPDRVIFDLDPGEGVTWPHVKESAVLMRAMLVELGLQSWIKTSGGKGLHVVVPLAQRFDYEVVKDFSQAVVQHMTRTIPQRFVAKAGGGNRIGKIFIDYLRNGHGQTTAAAFSARARPGLGVSMTIGWDELEGLDSGAQWNITTALDWLARRGPNPWAGYARSRQTLTAAMKTLGFEPRRAGGGSAL